jgi:small conductance mechanosensitive channel
VSESVAWFLSVPLRIVLIVVVALLANRFAGKSIRALMDRLGDVAADTGDRLVSERNRLRAEQRAATIGSLLRSISAGLILVISGVMILELLGLSVIPILASAGILGLAVGFGAQSVVEDFLRGLFMLGEDQFGVGDRIDIGTVNGFVERVTLRTTVIKDPNGIRWHVPNSEIGHVANENQLSNRAVVEVAVPYSVDTQRAMEVLAEAARAASAEPEWQDQVRQEPEVRGVQILGENAVVIRVQVWVAGGAMRQFQRHLRQRLKEGLYTAGIEVPNPGLDVWLQDSPAA